MGRKFFKGGALIAPVPAALVTCGTEGGKRNVLTAAWTGIINTRPPMAYVSVRPERHSHSIIMETGEFVINLTTSKMAKEVDFCGMKSGSKLDKFAKCRFETVKGETVDCPVILASPLALECKVRETKELGSHTMFLADVVGVTIDDTLLDEKNKFDLNAAGLVTYSHGEYYLLGQKLGTFGYSVKKRRKSAKK